MLCEPEYKVTSGKVKEHTSTVLRVVDYTPFIVVYKVPNAEQVRSLTLDYAANVVVTVAW